MSGYSRPRAPSLIAVIVAAANLASVAADVPKAQLPGVKLVPHDPKVFLSDPSYTNEAYSAEAQLKIYGDKRIVPTTRPFIELGRELYRQGPFQPGVDIVGKKNLVFANLLVSGDWRGAVAYNDTGAREFSIVATRVNLDVDLKFTATERVHAFFRPLDKAGQFTSYEFGAAPDRGKFHLDGNPEALFFEGDLGAIGAGLSGKESKADLPFTFGLVPLIFQNGVWMEDAITGFAFTLPARNSRVLDLANFDLTFFAGFDNVSSPAFTVPGGVDDSHAHVFGAAAFIEAFKGYLEIGYAYVDGRQAISDVDYHNFSIAYTRRYFHRLSNSLRVIVNTGQNRTGATTANGALFLIENALITSLPSTLVPYCNLFVGIDRPQSVARDTGAGGVLKNSGILFETDGLTGFPTLDASGADVWGGALGIEYLFSLNQQIVFEAAALQVIGADNAPGRPAKGDQYGVGIRYQIPLNQSLILRADAMIGWRNVEKDIAGVRVELRLKF